MKRFSLLCVALAVCVLSGSPAPARADDDPGLADGGSIATSSDGGRNVVVPLQVRVTTWKMATTCDSDSRYQLTGDGGLATAGSQLLLGGRTYDIDVNKAIPGVPAEYLYPNKRYVAFRTEDAGVPNCTVEFNH